MTVTVESIDGKKVRCYDINEIRYNLGDKYMCLLTGYNTTFITPHKVAKMIIKECED